jgi:hypothetical protein
MDHASRYTACFGGSSRIAQAVIQWLDRSDCDQDFSFTGRPGLPLATFLFWILDLRPYLRAFFSFVSVLSLSFTMTEVCHAQAGRDLKITSVDANISSVDGGQLVDLDWTVQNNGRSDCLGKWRDGVVLSVDASLDSQDQYLASFVAPSPLGGGRAYSQHQSILIPAVAPGKYNLILKTDALNNVPEIDETNNVSAAVPLTITASQKSLDLGVTDFSVSVPNAKIPAAGIGQYVDFTWTVKNQGTASTPIIWNDGLYLSKNKSLGLRDRLIASIPHRTMLAPGDSYTQKLRVQVPDMPLGGYFIILRVDHKNILHENNELNNLSKAQPVLIDSPRLLILPLLVSLSGGQKQQFTTTLPQQAVTWSLDANDPGSITAGGLYQAPEVITDETVVTIHAALNDGSGRASSLHIRLVTYFQIVPRRSALKARQKITFRTSAAIPVVWALQGPGTLDTKGNYTAPNSVSQKTRAIVTASSLGLIPGKARAVIYLLKDTFIRVRATRLRKPWGVLIRADDSHFLSERNPAVCLEKDGVCTPVAGTNVAGYSGDGGPAAQAQLDTPMGIVDDLLGNLYIADSGNNVIRKVDPAGKITTFAGGGSPADGVGDGGPALAAQLQQPEAVVVDTAQNLYIAEFKGNRVRKVAPDGTITTIAGTGVAGYNGDGIPATQAQLNGPRSLSFNTFGDLYIADYNNNRLRKILTNGTIFTLAGTGANGSTGDGGPASDADISTPSGVATDDSGAVYISEYETSRVRLVKDQDDEGGAQPADPVITTVAGNGTPGNTSGDEGLSNDTSLNSPSGVALDADGNMIIVDSGNDQDVEVTDAGSSGSNSGQPLGDPGNPYPLAGDVNLDARVNVQDGVTGLSSTVGLSELLPEQAGAADLDGNGKVNVQDVVVILLKAVGLFP